jgi:hypothetical protein
MVTDMSKLRRNEQIGGCSGGVGIFYKEKLYQRIQVLNNVETNVMWTNLKADEGKRKNIYRCMLQSTDRIEV